MRNWTTSRVAILASVFSLFSALATTSTAQAHQGRPYSVTVESEHGSRLPVFHQGGQVFVLGHYGERYTIRVHNHTARRVEAVVTVDGRDVVSGDSGDFVRQRGYVLPAYGDVLIEGFRQSMSHVAAFRFTSPGDSYSARRGTPQNVGIIGVAFFAERYVAPPPRPIEMPAPEPYYSRDGYGHRGHSRAEARRSAPTSAMGTGSGAPSAPASEASAPAAMSQERAARDDRESDSNIGTRYGETRSNQARQVSFVRANSSRPDFVTTLRYDDAEGLLARGINVYPHREPRPYVQVYPEAFPQNRFAPPPP